MARNVSSTVLDALQAQTVKMASRLTCYKSRVYFSTVTDQKPSWATTGISSGNPEALGYLSSELLHYTIAQENGEVNLLLQGTATPIVPTFSASPLPCSVFSRPGVYGNKIFYYSTDRWKVATLDEADVANSVAACVTAVADFATMSDGAIYPISSTSAIVLWIDDGGVAITFVDGSGNLHTCPSRFVSPTSVYAATDMAETHLAGATLFGDGVYVYFSARDGSVQVIKYTLQDDGENGTWSDINTAIPQDLCTTQVNSVWVNNNRVFLTCTFFRRAEFSTGKFFTLLSYSNDGLIFSLDRRVLCSLQELRFNSVMAGNNVVFSCTNRWYSAVAPYQVIGADTDKTVIPSTDIISVSGGDEKSLTLRAGNEQYFDDPYVKEGCYADLDVGIETSIGREWVSYSKGVISRTSTDVANGSRNMGLGLMEDGKWHIQAMTYPFYVQLLGQSMVRDNYTDNSKSYKQAVDDGLPWSLACDLWADENIDESGLSPANHAASASNDIWGPDLTTICSAYPVFGEAGSYDIKLYGWSRAGKMDTNPNTADDTPTNTPNDDFYAMLLVEDTDGNQTTIVTDTGDLTSAYKHPPQSWFVENTRAGSYPVVYSVTNPGAGMKIIKLGIRITASSTGQTVYYPERIEMPGIVAKYITQQPTEDFTTKVETQGWTLVDTIDLQVTTGNRSAGDLTPGSYNLRFGYAYAIIILGDVQFKNGGSDIVQDARLYGSGNSWETASPIALSAVRITAAQLPYLGTAEQVFQDNIPDGEQVNAQHYYTFTHDESATLTNSSLDARYVPYVWGRGEPASAALYLYGAGAITDIVGGAFKVYIFESPTPFDEFSFYGGNHDYATQIDLDSVTGGSYYPTEDPNPWDSPTAHFERSYAAQLGLAPAALDFSTTVFGPMKIRLYATVIVTGDIADDELNDSFIVFNVYGNPGVNLINTSTETNVVAGVPISYEFIWDNEGYDIGQLYVGGDLYSGLGDPVQMAVTLGFDVISVPTVPQVPTPPKIMSLKLPDLAVTVTHTITAASLFKKGTRQLMFTTIPYTAFNFDETLRLSWKGYGKAGLFGLCADKDNYIYGQIETGRISIGKLRAGLATELDFISNADIVEDKEWDIRLWHRNGTIGLEYKRPDETSWPQRESQLLYKWTEADGPLTYNDVWHLGAFGFIDPPRVRIAAFRSTSTNIGLMPADVDPDTGDPGFTIFPSSGILEIDGILYSYTGKTTTPSIPRGPFRICNTTTWPGYSRDGHTYGGGISMEINQFDWIANSSNYNLFLNGLLCVQDGHVYQIDATDWKPTIVTGGQLVYIRNRNRHFANDMVGDSGGRAWIAGGFTGVAPVASEDAEMLFNAGEFAFIHNDDQVKLFLYTAANGDPAYSISDLIDNFCAIAGTETAYPGDIILGGSAITENNQVAL